MSVSLPQLPLRANVKLGQVFLGVSLALAFLTAILFKALVLDRPAAQAPAVLTRTVVVARENVPMGAVLTPNDLKIVEWPEEYLPEGDVFTSSQALVGRVVRSEIHKGEPIARADLSGDASTGGLKVLIPAGLRAMTIAVSEVKGVAGFVKPGDRVDVVATFRNLDQEGNSKLELSKTVLQNVLVIAAAQEMRTPETSTKPAPPANPNMETGGAASTAQATAAVNVPAEHTEPEPAKLVTSVTLALTPKQIEALTLADETGSVRLVLRPEQDRTLVRTDGTTNTELYPVARPHVAMTSSPVVNPEAMPMMPAMAVQGHLIEVIDGDQKSTISF